MGSSGLFAGVVVKTLRKFADSRGWLGEVWRGDEPEGGLVPAMGYLSSTLPGQVRGPHEHVRQTDYFIFCGTSRFLVALWENRSGSTDKGRYLEIDAPQDVLTLVIIPPGVVHCYKNTGTNDGLVLNFPDALYAGRQKKEPVDEIRHENEPGSPFVLRE